MFGPGEKILSQLLHLRALLGAVFGRGARQDFEDDQLFPGQVFGDVALLFR